MRASYLFARMTRMICFGLFVGFMAAGGLLAIARQEWGYFVLASITGLVMLLLPAYNESRVLVAFPPAKDGKHRLLLPTPMIDAVLDAASVAVTVAAAFLMFVLRWGQPWPALLTLGLAWSAWQMGRVLHDAPAAEA